MFILSTQRDTCVGAGIFVSCSITGLFLLSIHTAHAQFTDFTAVSAETEASETSGPAAPVISSTEFPEPDRWYTTLDGSFRWVVPSDVSAVAVEMATSTSYEPLFVYEPPITKYTPPEEELIEGVQYIAVQFRNADGWGDIAYRKLQIDRTSPSGLYIDIIPTGAPGTSALVFGATDTLSGIAGYALYVGGEGPIYLSPEAAGKGYEIAQTESGMYQVLVVAYDRAGNTTSNKFPVFVLDHENAPAELWFGIFTTRELAGAGLLILTMLALWNAMQTRRHYASKERKLRNEMYEIGEQMGKIFSALRDEIFDQIQSIRKRSRLTKGEKTVVENLNRALEVSETLVEKEIKDVKKLLK